MFSTTAATLFALLALGANAIKVTSPSDTSLWKSSDLNQELKWEAVSSDATSFAVVLVNMGSVNHMDSPVTLISNQSTSAGSVTISPPSGTNAWPTGVAYQINLVKSERETNSILAQSGMFNITQGESSSSSSSSSVSASASSSSASSSSSATRSAATTTTGTTGVATSAASGTASSSAAVSGIPPSSSGTSAASASFNLPSSGMGLITGSAVLAGVGYFVSTIF